TVKSIEPFFPKPAPIVESFTQKPLEAGVAFVDLRAGGCKYELHGIAMVPATSFRFCGEPVHAEGKPYCEGHRRICWTPTARQEKRAGR
ncbi:MAG: hypothetical protein KGI70_03270, partial [Patescibacteria group bacterium]|nr:hypothetical protein [Patescibacteria group bacterium]